MTDTRAQAERPAERAVHTVPLRRVLGQVRRSGPIGLIDALGEQAQGRMIRLKLGPFRPLIVTHPDDVRHVLHHAENYPRGAAMWAALGRLVGDGIGGEGPQWRASRDILQGVFGGAYQRQTAGQMADSVTAAVDALAGRVGHGQVVDPTVEMTRVVQRVIDPIFFGNLIPDGEGDRLGAAVGTAMGSLLWRMAMPFVPHWIPLPGDRAFRRATREVYAVLEPVLAQARHAPRDRQDVVTRLLQGTNADGEPMTDEQVTRDIVALFVAGSESSAIGLTWILTSLAAHPEVCARVRAEVARVGGGGPLRAEHIRSMTYTHAMVEEVLRIWSVGWAVPRVAVDDDVIGGVPVKAGTTLVISPYLVHRLERFWPDPLRFDPDRPRPEHPYAFLPFGATEHMCLGQTTFYREAALIVGALVQRFDLALEEPVEPKLSLTVQPSSPPRLRLTPRR